MATKVNPTPLSTEAAFRWVITDGQVDHVPQGYRWLAEEIARIPFSPYREVSFLVAKGNRLIRVWAGRSAANSITVSCESTQSPFGLTIRQLEVLSGIACGMTNPTIAKHLNLAVKTVARHVEHLLLSLECASRVELAVLAVRRNLILLPHQATSRAFAEAVRSRLIEPTEHDAQPAPAFLRPIACYAIYPAGDRSGNVVAMQGGARLALEQQNGKGGIAGRRLTLFTVETESPREAVSSALDAGADAILLGNFPIEKALDTISATCGSGVPVLHSMVAPQLNEAVLSVRGFENVYQVCGLESAYAHSFAKTLSALLQQQRSRSRGSVSLALRPHMYNEHSIEQIEELLSRHGLEILTLISLEELERTPESALKLLQGSPDAVHLPILTEPTFRSVLPFLRSNETLTFADWFPSSPKFLKRMGEQAEGIYWSTIIGAGDDERYRTFRSAYASSFGEDPGRSVAAVHFDIVRLLSNAWSQTNQPWNFDSVHRFLRMEVFNGIAGPYWFGGRDRRGRTRSIDSVDDALAQPIRSFQVRSGQHRMLSV